MAGTVFDLLAERLPGRAGHPALVLGGRALSFAELHERALAFAAWLERAGVAPGERVGISLPKGFEEVVATLGAARAGAVFVNVHHQWTPRQLEHVAADCAMRVLVCDARRARTLADPERFEHLAVVGAKEAAGRVTPFESWPEGARPERALPGERELAALLYTSGSTGRPKGVMLTHRNVVRGAVSVTTYLENGPEDRVLGLLPMSFDYGLSQLTTMLLVGGTLVLQPVFMPAEIARTARAEEVTGIALVPPSWIQLVRTLDESGERLSSLRYVTNSGGKIPGAILDRMPAVFPGVRIFLMYGLTEAFRSTYLPPEDFERKKGAIGRAIPGEDVWIVHPETGLCGPDEPGEIVHRGELVSLGYWNDPEATARRIRSSPHLAHLIGDERVVFSGDWGWRDADGCLWFRSRADAMIKCSGYRLSPTEVEELVYESGLVGDVIAFGEPDPELGQVVHVAVTAAREDAAVDRDGLLRWCREAMPSYMIPRAVHAWDGPFPRTASGKFDRPAVLRAVRGEAPEGAVPDREPPFEKE